MPDIQFEANARAARVPATDDLSSIRRSRQIVDPQINAAMEALREAPCVDTGSVDPNTVTPGILDPDVIAVGENVGEDTGGIPFTAWPPADEKANARAISSIERDLCRDRRASCRERVSSPV